MIKYSTDHEWIKVEGDTATVGISAYAQKRLGDIVFVELPQVGDEIDAGGEIAVVESVKAASDIYAPVAGEVTAINETLEDAPETVNTAPTEGGWFIKMTVSDASQLDALMDESAYKEYCEGL